MRDRQLRGLNSAPEFFIDGMEHIEFHGVTSLLIPYRLISGSVARHVPLIIRCPTGALALVQRQFFEFGREHQLVGRWPQDGTA